MSTGMVIMLALLLLAVTVILVMGVVGMIRSGGENPQRSNKLMQWRVALQALAVLLLFLMLTTQT